MGTYLLTRTHRPWHRPTADGETIRRARTIAAGMGRSKITRADLRAAEHETGHTLDPAPSNPTAPSET